MTERASLKIPKQGKPGSCVHAFSTSNGTLPQMEDLINSRRVLESHPAYASAKRKVDEASARLMVDGREQADRFLREQMTDEEEWRIVEAMIRLDERTDQLRAQSQEHQNVKLTLLQDCLR